MYFPIGWPKYFREVQKEKQPLQYVISNCDRMLFAILTEDSISIWYCKPAVQIVCHTLSQNDIHKYGELCMAEWKPDSSMIAVITRKHHIIFFKVDLDVNVPNHHCLYVQNEAGKSSRVKKDINGIQDSESVPAIKLSAASVLQLHNHVTWCICVREELVVSTIDGTLHRIKWNATVNKKATLCINNISVSIDFQNSKAARVTESEGHVKHMEYSPIIGGYILVLSTGKALFVIPPSQRTDNSLSPMGVWVKDLNNAACLCVNHRYRQIAFGCTNGLGVVYVINEAEGVFEMSFKLAVSSKDFPDAAQRTGAVYCMKWTPDGTALAMCWENGGFSLWSVFGSLLVCTLGDDYGHPGSSMPLFPPPVKSLEWGLEGYQLWVVTHQRDSDENNKVTSSLIQFQFVKSALTVNPCMSNHEHVFLQGEDKLYMNTGDVSQRFSSHHGKSTAESHLMVGNKNWQIIPISHSYLADNWPIRYAAVDRAGQCLAVAGKTGLAHYTFINRKWKLFGNETQERDMVVSGGMAWWREFICVACYNIVGQKDEIRCYPRNCKLDNTFSSATKVPSQVLLLNIFRDILIVFCIDSHIMIFNMERKNTQSNPAIELLKLQEVSLCNYVPHPVCVTGLALTSLRTELGPKAGTSFKEAESLLLNVAGKLLMFQRDVSGPQLKDQKTGKSKQNLPFCPPSIVATNVENMWSTSRANEDKVQLMEALWLGCGADGMKVWLPLYPKDNTKAMNFLSKRIMLPFSVNIYPLAVLFEDAVILGAAGDAMSYQFPSSTNNVVNKHNNPVQYLPFCTLERTSQIYLHHILRQLLRRNLGVCALDLARSCKELTYFPHVLELLLHEVLETEATSKEPIPDPLLPRIVAFIQEFPEFLQTVVHCARKTEVALWPHLFSVVGNPKDLFEECLINGELDTAASYLLILQNLEKPMISRQHATLLLDSALEKCKWDLARDLVRFLKAIDPSETDPSYNGTASQSVSSSSSKYSSGIPSPPISSPHADGYNFTRVSNVSHINRVRSSSVTSQEVQNVPKGSGEKQKLKHTFSADSAFRMRKMSPKLKEESVTDQLYIDGILCRHAKKLLEAHRLRDLGYFTANIDEIHIVSWLKKERLKSAKLDDFVKALKDLHMQFCWPFPVLSLAAFQRLKKKTLSSTSLPSLSAVDEEGAFTAANGPASPATPGFTLKSDSQPELNSSYSIFDDIILKPQMSKSNTEESSLATVEVSDNSSLLGEYECLGDASSIESLSAELEILSHEVANKGPQQSELELRYLLQVMLEAGCLEWSLIISIILRDALAVVRTVNTASMTDTPLDMVARMREGLSYLELWSDTECLGYKPFFHAIRGQILLLGKLVEQTPPTLQLSTTPVDACPLDDGQVSPVTQSIRTLDLDSTPEDPEGQPSPDRGNECSVS